MAFCQKCGRQLPKLASFCPGCGVEVSADELQADLDWETCEIGLGLVAERWGLFPADMLRFIARAEGPKGVYTAGTSPEFKAGLGNYYQPDKKNKRHNEALVELERILEGDSWEKTGCGGEWFQLRFRRRTGPSPEQIEG